eukprot:TRINITY_DN402_c0_g1_i3.p1 TRINITY_DN402_c0_g1~~TRINITY_DN402_c0_g1_i3.p1  ORF type:complete len:361 (+),score=74.65 TRINITY_DN402_c0_g1_i3:94-1083(+)
MSGEKQTPVRSRSFEGLSSVGKASGEAVKQHPDVPLFSREGLLLRRDKGRISTAWKQKKFILLKGSLFCYSRKPNRLTPKGVLHLNGCVVLDDFTEKKMKRKFVFSVQNMTDKSEWILAADTEADKLEWVRLLRCSLTLPASPPPEILFKRKTGTTSVKEAFVDGVTSFAPSRRVIKEFVTDDSFRILEAVKSFLTQYDSAKQAEWVEKSILAIGMKVGMMYRDKKITKSAILVIQNPIHRLVDRLIDAYEIPFTFSHKELMDLATEVQDALLIGLKPYLDDKTMSNLSEVLRYFLNDELVMEFFSKKKWKECQVVGSTLRTLWDAGRI